MKFPVVLLAELRVVEKTLGLDGFDFSDFL